MSSSSSCDVLIVGGGPAGSTCATRLVAAGASVTVLDRAEFPRDKVCTGWITPAVCAAVSLDRDDYARGRTLQPITGFRTGRVHGAMRLNDFGDVVSHAIRRCEFDEYLLRRSGARLVTGQPLTSLRRTGDGWTANESIRADLVVGAGGHFCPVARQLNPDLDETPVVAQEIEVPLPPGLRSTYPVRGEWPELFFWPDLLGYGWCVRKGDFLNIGVGRLRQHGFPAAAREFAQAIAARGLAPAHLPARWKGHAYLLYTHATRVLYDEAVLLIGDAAGMSLAPSGEGILAAVESGTIAAATILEVGPPYTRSRLAEYRRRIEARFGPRAESSAGTALWPGWLTPVAARAVLGVGWLTRRWLLEEGFLHRHRPLLGS
jgi:menaquinone-9 beta-reductase